MHDFKIWKVSLFHRIVFKIVEKKKILFTIVHSINFLIKYGKKFRKLIQVTADEEPTYLYFPKYPCKIDKLYISHDW